ncbi:MAG: hypothetical protein LC635_03425 [Pseudonocardiaceae bacterium]|nr:hypothetical protein [Pseudonocardiaceae bacterium]
MPMIDLTLPKGRFDRPQQEALAAEGDEPTPENLMRVWCVIDEVADGNWGVGPGPLRLRDLAARFGVRPGDARWEELRFDQR